MTKQEVAIKTCKCEDMLANQKSEKSGKGTVCKIPRGSQEVSPPTSAHGEDEVTQIDGYSFIQMLFQVKTTTNRIDKFLTTYAFFKAFFQRSSLFVPPLLPKPVLFSN